MSARFEQCDAASGTTVSVALAGEGLLIEEMVQALESLLLAAGYHLPPGVHIGFEEDDAPLVPS